MHDPSYAKEYYNFYLKRKKKSRSVTVEHSKRHINYPKTIRQAEKVS